MCWRMQCIAGRALTISTQELAPVACLTAAPVEVLHGVMLPLSTPPPRFG